jgi:hypothetical protein
MPLQGSSLGFRTDKDSQGGYPEAVVIECATEALLRGLRLTGNEWNIIGGRCYVAQAGCARLVSTYPGLTDLEHAPGVPVMGNGGAIVEYTMRWKLDGVAMGMTRRIPVRVNGGMGMDAVLGKAKRKMLAAVYERLTGSVLSEGEPEESLTQARPARSLTEQHGLDVAAAPTMDALKAVVDRINADIKANKINKDQNAALASLITERKKQLADAAQQAADTFPLTGEAEDEDSSDPPAPPQNFAGGDMAKRIVELLTEQATGIDWTQIRDDKIGPDLKPSEAGGIAKHCGFTPSPTLKVAELCKDSPAAGLKLYELLKGKANAREANRAKRAAGKAGAK